MNDMLFLFPQLTSLIIKYATITAICSIRLLTLSVIFPPLSEGGIEKTTLRSVLILFSVYISYGQWMIIAEPPRGMALIGIVLRETMFGFLLGIAASSVFWVAESAGIYIDNLTGYNNVQLTNPQSQDQATPTSTLLKQIATAVFWSLGGMMSLLSTVYESYSWWPITSSEPISRNILESFILNQTDTLMQVTAKLALPIVFVLLLVDLALGFASKSAEKLELSALGQPLKGALGVLMLALLAGLFVDQTSQQITLVDLGRQLRHALRH